MVMRMTFNFSTRIFQHMLAPLPSMRRSRHVFLRILSVVVGLASLGLLLFFGLLAAGILLVGGSALLAWRYWTRRRPVVGGNPSFRTTHGTQPKVLEGEFVVVQRERSATR